MKDERGFWCFLYLLYLERREGANEGAKHVPCIPIASLVNYTLYISPIVKGMLY